MQQNIESILDAAEQQQASDVFLQEDEIPRLKINEQIIVLGDEPLSLAHITAFWQACGGNAQGDGDMDRDTGFVSRTHTRYRVSLHRTMGRHDGALFESFSGGKREAWCEPSGKPAFWRPVPEAGSIC